MHACKAHLAAACYEIVESSPSCIIILTFFSATPGIAPNPLSVRNYTFHVPFPMVATRNGLKKMTRCCASCLQPGSISSFVCLQVHIAVELWAINFSSSMIAGRPDDGLVVPNQRTRLVAAAAANTVIGRPFTAAFAGDCQWAGQRHTDSE